MRVSLSSYPSPSKTLVAEFPNLSGGLNKEALDYRMDADQSPDLVNLWWNHGVLETRDGQVWRSDTERGTGYACCYMLPWGYALFHIGTKLFAGKERTDAKGAVSMAFTELCGGVPERRGTFFRYGDSAFYKNNGGFFRVRYDEAADTFSAGSVAAEAYCPVTVLNADPDTGSGTLYQPENRLSAQKEVHYNAKEDVKVYHLPVQGLDSVDRVTVDGTDLAPGTGYTANLSAGTVTFSAAPPVTVPPTNNTVEIVYSKANADAYNGVMRCSLAAVYGEGQNLCILLSGNGDQPNAVFWNSNDHLSMNPAYFPISYYNLCGSAVDAVTGFGRQYNDLILFQREGIGKLVFSVEQIDGRDSISFVWQAINSAVGCDLPGSIQVIENNLVFASSRRGVFLLQSSSAAYENNVVCVSGRVNGDTASGLLADIRTSPVVASADDGRRYYLRCAGGAVYVWDYSISGVKSPSWFYFTGIQAVDFYLDGEQTLHHLDAAGRVTAFARQVYSDYGAGFEKHYVFPTLSFGSFERLKDVRKLVVEVRGDTEAVIPLHYDTDYEDRDDLTPIRAFGGYSWVPRDLSGRDFGVLRWGSVARRDPGCRHVRFFRLTLRNNEAGANLAIASVQVYYRFTGRER